MKQTAMILEVLESGPQPSREIANLTGIKLATVSVRLSEMKNMRQIVVVGQSNDSFGRPRNLWGVAPEVVTA